MARKLKNRAPKDIVVVNETGANGKVSMLDVTNEDTLLATLQVVDRDTAPELRDNVLSVSDDRFEIRDGALYVLAGSTFTAGEVVEIELIASDAGNPDLSYSEKLKIRVGKGPVATALDDSLHLNYAGHYSITTTAEGGWRVETEGGSLVLTQAQAAAIRSIETQGDNHLSLDRSVVDGNVLAVNGEAGETLDIVGGVTFTESAGGVSVGSNTDVSGISVDLDMVILVNGSRVDGFKAAWNMLDDAYSFLQSTYGNDLMFGANGYTESDALPEGMVILGQSTTGAAALAVNHAVTALDIAYAKYLANGGSAEELLDFTAKTNAAGTREQTLHDNLLGGASAAAIGDRNFPQELEDALVADIPAEFADRPYASGNLDAYGRTDAGTNAAKAWDYAHGIERPDYVTHFTGPVDPSGTQADGSMWFGAGNPSTGYTIAVHDGEGIEFGWNLHYRTGDQIAGEVQDDGLVHFEAPAGHQQAAMGHNVQGDNLNRSAVSLDYGIVSGLNGTSETVADYEIHVLIDRDPTAAQDYKAFTLVSGGDGINYLLADDGSGGMGDEDGLNPMLSENSMNFGFGFLTNSITGSSGDLQPGTYDVVATVLDDGVVLLTNHIVLDLYPFL